MSEVSVRYIVDDVDAAVAFYVDHLGFEVRMRPAPGFAALTRGGLTLMLNRPGAGGAGQGGDDGAPPAPGGWNRFRIEVEDLAATVTRLEAVGCRFRSGIIHGNGGDQIVLDDPSGNPIELFQPPRRGG